MMMEQSRIGPYELDTVHCADALDWLRTLPDGCADAVVTDPPYAQINRSYGRLTEPEWHGLMRGCTLEMRRILKPRGSAMMVLQPNFERLGRMRLWVWEFMAWAGREWNIVQDAYWWNHAAVPTAGVTEGLMRQSVKYCIWLGAPDCYRDSLDVLWKPSQSTLAISVSDRALWRSPSGMSTRPGRIITGVLERGGSSPYNLLPIANTNSTDSGGANRHGAATPAALVDWWIRYISPPGGVVLDPFMGSGTTALVARDLGRHYIGADINPEYVALAQRRLTEPYTLALPLAAPYTPPLFVEDSPATSAHTQLNLLGED